MKTKYYLFGGQVAAPAYRWKGYTLPGLTRVASDTRGLSGDPEVEYLPYRPSGPEPQDPGEGSGLAGVLDGMSDLHKAIFASFLGGLASGIALDMWRKRRHK